MIVHVQGSEVYSDPVDVFVREPFLVRFRSDAVVADAAQFTLVAIHTRPEAAVKEIDALMDVLNYVS